MAEQHTGEGGGGAAGPRGSVFSTFKSPTAVAQAGTQGAGEALPHLDRIQDSFGRHDVSGVRAHVGGSAQDAAADLGAHAFAVGDAVGFGSTPDLRTAAHEAAHVVQQRSGVQLAGGIDGGNADPYERHADDVADAVVAGRSAEAILDAGPRGGGENVAVQRRSLVGFGGGFGGRLSDNPGEQRDEDGNPTTEHRAPTMGDAVNHYPNEQEGEQTEQNVRVKVRADKKHGLKLAPDVQPRPEQLWTESRPGGSERDGVEVKSIGSVEAPTLIESPAPSIYIQGAPRADDVHQGYLGDCYFLAMVASLAQNDPGKIKAIMKPDGKGGATVSLWRKQEVKQTWLTNVVRHVVPGFEYKRVQLSVSHELQAWIGGGIKNAQLRAAEQPLHSTWWANVAGSSLQVNRDDTYEVARWVPLLEKAFARHAQEYGQYGGAREGNAAQPDGSGYDVIEGGWMNATLPLVYGPEADTDAAAVTENGITWAPEAGRGLALLKANQGAFDQLLLMAGKPPQRPHSGERAPIVTAAAMEGDFAARLGPAVKAAIASPGFKRMAPESRLKFHTVLAAWTMWNNLPPDSEGVTAKQSAYEAMRKSCGNVTVTYASPVAMAPEVERNNPKTLFFKPGTSKFESEEGDGGMLTDFGNALGNNPTPEMSVTVIGHSTKEDGWQVSTDRANVVVERLKQAVKTKAPGHGISGYGVGYNGEGSMDRADIQLRANPTVGTEAGWETDAVQAALDLMLDLRTLDEDPLPTQGNVIGNHAYTIMSVAVRDHAGGAIAIAGVPQAKRPELYPHIDTGLSTVRVRNPWRMGEPDRRGNNEPARPGDGDPYGGGSDGIYTLSLEQFFRNFSTVHSAVFKKTQ